MVARAREKLIEKIISPRQKKVLIVATQSLFREGLKALVQQDPCFAVVGLARSGQEAISEAVRTKPEIVVIDLCLSDGSWVELIRRIHRLLPGARVMVVSPDAQPERVTAAVEAGAVSFLQRDSPRERFMQCLAVAGAGGLCVDDRTLLDLSHARTDVPLLGRCPDADPAGSPALSPRDLRVLRGIAEGKTLKVIAADLQISVKTVANRRSRILNNLHLDTAVDIVRYAARIGMIEVNDWNEAR